MQSRPLRPFEQGAHLHVLDWTHATVRHRFQAAGAVQVKAATKAIVNGKVSGPPQLPSLEAALTQELRKLYAVGHATVRSELMHQESRAPLPVGLSAVSRATLLDWHFNPDEPRDWHGRWGSGGGSHLGAELQAQIESSPQYRDKTYRELLEIRTSMSKQVARATADGNAEGIAKWQGKFDVLTAHIEARKEAATHARRVAAQAEVSRTGALSVTKDEMREILGKPGDAYHDAGLKPPFDYNPGLFKTSDLSGKGVRHYVTLPDGRIAHPDEFHEARARGRIVVVDEVPLPPDAPRYLSAAPSPPNLRAATGAKKRCGTCKMFDNGGKMFDNGACWGYGNYGVEADELCDSWAPETVKTLALGDQALDAGSLRARARLTVADVSHQIWQAVQRARLHGVSDQRTLKQIGRQAGNGALAQQASHHAGGAINGGRRAAAGGNAQVIGARYTSVLDKSTCGPCAEADTGELIPLGDPRWVPTPNPACLGGGRCRCIHVYQLSTEKQPSSILPPEDFPSEPRQPDRPSGVSRIPVAQVGVGGS